jgi:hypothetical protein
MFEATPSAQPQSDRTAAHTAMGICWFDIQQWRLIENIRNLDAIARGGS